MRESGASRVELPPLLVSVPQAAQMIGRGHSKIYDLIGEGTIKAVKSDNRTLIVVASLHEYVASLPLAKVAAPRVRPPPPLRAVPRKPRSAATIPVRAKTPGATAEAIAGRYDARRGGVVE